MVLLRWLMLSQPIIRQILLVAFPLLLMLYPWLPETVSWWGAWIALGVVQGIASAFVGAAVVLFVAIPFYMYSRRQDLIHGSREELLHDDRFLTRLIWPQRIVGFAVLLYGFFSFADMSLFEIRVIFALTIWQFFSYVAYAPLLTQRLNFLRMIENGIILLVSVGLAVALGGLIIIALYPDWMPSTEESIGIGSLFCATIYMAYQEYLNRKHMKMAQRLK